MADGAERGGLSAPSSLCSPWSDRGRAVGRGLVLAVMASLGTLAGCSPDGAGDGAGPQPASSGGAEDANPLEFSVLARDTIFGGLSDLKAVGEYLVVLDEYSETVVHLVRRADGTLLGSFGTRGEGPGEFEGPWRIFTDSAEPGSCFWIYDFDLRRLTPGCVEEDSVRFEPVRIVDLSGGELVYSARPVADSLVLGLGFYPRGRFGVYDRTGTLVEIRGQAPPGDGDVSTRVRQHAYQSFLALRPEGQRLVVASLYAGRIELYGIDGSLHHLAETPERFTPRYKVAAGERGPAFVPTGELRHGYIDVAATDSLIYGLFSGRELAETGRPEFGTELHVFDWNGQLVRTVSLAGEHPAIALGPRGRRLYAPVWDPTPGVVVYELPSGGVETG